MSELEKLAKKIEKLSLAEQLHLAAGLIEHGKEKLAEDVAGSVVAVLAARRIFGKDRIFRQTVGEE